MKIVMTGGGTAGHVTPNLALVPYLLELGYRIEYVGTRDGIERELVEGAGIPFHAIRAGKLRRYPDLRNLLDPLKTLVGFIQSLAILGRRRPDVVFSKGGYVACPVVWAAWVRRIAIVTHESDLTPGLANQLCMPFARRICVSFPETLARVPHGRGVLTGIPIRRELFRGSAERGRGICGFTEGMPVVLVIGGSQGSEAINDAIGPALPDLTEEFQVCHVRGKGNTDPDLDGIQVYKQFEYVTGELPHLYAMADLVVCRAGATTIFELLALRKPNLLIPLPANASRGDQIENARSFAEQGFSRVLPQEALTPETFVERIRSTYEDRDTLIEAISASPATDSAARVAQVILDLRAERTDGGAI